MSLIGRYMSPLPPSLSAKCLQTTPLRTSISSKEKVSTDKNQKRVKTVVTVTTSRHAGQRIINKSTLTTTTNTNTHGVVISGQPDYFDPPEMKTHSKDDQIIRKSKNNNVNVKHRETANRRSFINTSHPSKILLSQGRPTNSKELDELKHKKVVGILRNTFENVNNVLSNKENRFEKKCFDECKKGPRKSVKFLDDGGNVDKCEIERKRSDGGNWYKPDEIRCDDNAIDASHIRHHQGQRVVSSDNKEEVDETHERIDDAIGTDHRNDAPLGLQHLKTFTFSIPKSSLYKVSSKELKSILARPTDLVFSKSTPVMSDPIQEHDVDSSCGVDLHARNECCHSDDEEEIGVQYRPQASRAVESKDTRQTYDSFDKRYRLDSAGRDGLDYGRIWGPAMREVEIKPQRHVTCYKDYLY